MMTPGFYEGIPFQAYNDAEGIRSGLLRNILARPRKTHLQPSNPSPPEEDTLALQLGRALHCYMLTPELFFSECVVEPKGTGEKGRTRNTNWYKDWLESIPKGMTIIPRASTKTALGFDDFPHVREALTSHPLYEKYLTGGWAETTIFWENEFGQGCKIRPDYITKPGVFVDYKTTRHADLRNFQRDFFKLGYHQQAAFYMDGGLAVGLPVQQFVFVAQEKEWPYEVAFYPVDDDVIQYGREQNAEALRILRENDFPLLNGGEETWIELPAYLQTNNGVSLYD